MKRVVVESEGFGFRVSGPPTRPLPPFPQGLRSGVPGGRNSSAERHGASPNALTLDLTASQGSFRQQWTLFTESLVALPGNRDAWPQDVVEGTQPLVVVEKENLPYITLSAGSHTVTGRFTWPRLPEQVHIPSATGLVHLTLNHQIVPFPKQDPNGQLWMQQPTTAATGVSNTFDLQVFRRISDDIPFQILTRIQLDLDGEARELLLGQALLPSFIPFSLTSPLPPRLEPDGRLRIQVRPGRCTVDPDQLQLSRSYWLDFPGAGYTIQDTITGTVNKT
jgi:hypothetical protein